MQANRVKTYVSYGLWELAVLALLRESPMHPYQMQKLLHERHKDEFLALKRGSLYHAIYRLERAGLIAVLRTGRTGKRPERTTYRITARGRTELVTWLWRLVGAPTMEANEFMAAFSFLPLLTVAQASKELAHRTRALESEIADLTASTSWARTFVPRIHLIENEYLLAMRKTELAWVRSCEKELRTGKLRRDLRKIFAEAQVVKSRAAAAAGKPGAKQAQKGETSYE